MYVYHYRFQCLLKIYQINFSLSLRIAEDVVLFCVDPLVRLDVKLFFLIKLSSFRNIFYEFIFICLISIFAISPVSQDMNLVLIFFRLWHRINALILALVVSSLCSCLPSTHFASDIRNVPILFLFIFLFLFFIWHIHHKLAAYNIKFLRL